MNLPDRLHDARAELLGMHQLISECATNLDEAILFLEDRRTISAKATARRATRAIIELESRSFRVREIISQYLTQ